MTKARVVESGYGALAKSLHWLVVALLASQYALGWLMPHVGRNTKPEGLIAWHLWIGALLVVVLIIRFIWRFLHPVPLITENGPRWQSHLARLTHWSLYGGLALLLALGWGNASARGWSVTLFGMVPLPPLSPVGARIGMQAGDVHSLVGWGLLAIIGLHVLAALYHYLIRRDQVLQRMLPGS